MSLHNTPTSFGTLARAFHWLTALVILTAIPLGLIANGLSTGPDSIALKTQLFSLHKTLGVAAFFLGVARIVWAVIQPRPVPLHPARRLETAVAETVHWLLYLSLVIVPLSGWVHHAALDGFAPILWPFGQGLPFVPKSEAVSALAGGAHWLFTKVLAVAILMHVAGAVKHHVIDRDATLRRMMRGVAAPAAASAHRLRLLPLALALGLYGAGAALAVSLTPAAPQADAVASSAAPEAPASAVGAETAGNWQVESGTLGFQVQQMGAPVEGRFANWSAEITFDDTVTSGPAGRVVVLIDIGSLALGSVSEQAKGPEFFDQANHPTARFEADLIAVPSGHVAQGVLALRGIEQPITLPFTLEIAGDKASMTGRVTLDRRDFGIGAGYGDEATVGFAVDVAVTLSAARK
ncbi:MAG: cytochrome b/b6 domain-containing protein [Paracoccaceae bacterium]